MLRSLIPRRQISTPHPKEAQKADKRMHDKLDEGLEGTFAVSDPPGALIQRNPRALISAKQS
jgi:hypothetical protein